MPLTFSLASPEFDALVRRVKALEQLLQGVERVVAPDGTPGLYIPMRVGIISKYFLTQPAGDGNSLTVSTGVDKVCTLIQHDGAEGADGLGKNSPTDRIALKVVNTDPNLTGKNRAIVAIAANAARNVAVDERSSVSSATGKATFVEEHDPSDP